MADALITELVFLALTLNPKCSRQPLHVVASHAELSSVSAEQLLCHTLTVILPLSHMLVTHCHWHVSG